MWCGMKIHIFHQVDEKPAPESMGSIFPLVAPFKVNVKNKGEWNTFRILMDWPRLRVWTNGEPIQDVDVRRFRSCGTGCGPDIWGWSHFRIRSGFAICAFGNYRQRRHGRRCTQGRRTWRNGMSRMASRIFRHLATCSTATAWGISRPMKSIGISSCRCTYGTRCTTMAACCSTARVREIVGGTTRFNCTMWRARTIQTGSLYGVKRGIYPRIAAGEWWLFQLRVKDAACLVRINGDTIVEYERLDNLEEGPIELQAHDAGKFTEYKRILVRRI